MDIVPIQLSLTAGDLITLWAPRWREDGEEWEGFLGDEDAVHAFPDAAALAAYVRTVDEHDLNDHPAWSLVHQLTVAELVPDEDHCYDVVGTPEIVADEPDTWTVSELAGIITLIRSLADTCELDAVHDVLNSAEGFALLERGTWSFTGRDGGKIWQDLGDAIAGRWDEVIDALDAIVVVPEVNPAALAAARKELAADRRTAPEAPTDSPVGAPTDADADSREAGTEQVDAPTERPLGDQPASDANLFWEEVGIDPILISTDGADHYTLRCYLNDKPVFLGGSGRIEVFTSERALAGYLAGASTADGDEANDMARTSTWPEVVERAGAGELVVEVQPQNVYQLAGLGEDLAEGPTAVEPSQLDLAVELLEDVGTWANDDTASIALAPSQSLGWLTSCVLKPDPNRLTPSPPFDAEVERWNSLVNDLVKRFRQH